MNDKGMQYKVGAVVYWVTIPIWVPVYVAWLTLVLLLTGISYLLESPGEYLRIRRIEKRRKQNAKTS